jgi:AcrR family transcriptional regulator
MHAPIPIADPTGTDQPANKHTARRLETRASLLKAARDLIDKGRLTSFAVDEVCRLAGVSRAGFYLHFSGKPALLDALQQEMSDWYVRQFRKLDAETAATEDGLVGWLTNFARGFTGSRPSILLFTAREDGMPGLGARSRGEAILILGGQVPAFRLVKDDGGIDEERRIGLLLLVFQLEQLCLHLALDAPSDAALHLRVLARQFLHFMALGSDGR